MKETPPSNFFNLCRVSALAISCALNITITDNARASAVTASASGALPSDIQAAVNNFRTSIALGGGNNGTGGFFTNGFRNINWDGVDDAFSEPNVFPGNFFNSNSLRGLKMSTPGAEFLLSADSSNPTNNLPEFGSLDPSYPGSFQTFSPERLFVPFGSTITDNSFFVPTSPETRASIFGFGVVFTDVDIFGGTSLEFFDVNGRSLGTFNAPVQNNGLSFLGVSFNGGERIGAVRIIAGTRFLDAGVVESSVVDVVAMDDFMYSEPQAIVPEAGVAALLFVGTGGLVALRRREPVFAAA
jgi:hypothetical protein